MTFFLSKKELGITQIKGFRSVEKIEEKDIGRGCSKIHAHNIKFIILAILKCTI